MSKVQTHEVVIWNADGDVDAQVFAWLGAFGFRLGSTTDVAWSRDEALELAQKAQMTVHPTFTFSAVERAFPMPVDYRCMNPPTTPDNGGVA
jgi:hypothetical protein